MTIFGEPLQDGHPPFEDSTADSGHRVADSRAGSFSPELLQSILRNAEAKQEQAFVTTCGGYLMLPKRIQSVVLQKYPAGAVQVNADLSQLDRFYSTASTFKWIDQVPGGQWVENLNKVLLLLNKQAAVLASSEVSLCLSFVTCDSFCALFSL